MAPSHLSTDEFLSRLAALFESRRASNHGSVFLTQKRLVPHDLPKAATDTPLPPSSPFPDLHPPHPLPIIIRATNGKSKEQRKDKLNLSTLVQADELEGFFMRYVDVCKTGMSALKKRDRSGRKAKGKAKRKEKKGGSGVGPEVEMKV